MTAPDGRRPSEVLETLALEMAEYSVTATEDAREVILAVIDQWADTLAFVVGDLARAESEPVVPVSEYAECSKCGVKDDPRRTTCLHCAGQMQVLSEPVVPVSEVVEVLRRLKVKADAGFGSGPSFKEGVGHAADRFEEWAESRFGASTGEEPHSCDDELRATPEFDVFRCTPQVFACSCGWRWEHVCDEAEGCSWIPTEEKQ